MFATAPEPISDLGLRGSELSTLLVGFGEFLTGAQVHDRITSPTSLVTAAGFTREDKRIMKRVIASILAIAILAFTAPAGADRPVEFTDSVTFPATNPCSGLDHEVTIDFEIRLHEHGNKVIVHLKRTGTTDDGYVMDHGVENQVFNGNIFRAAFTDNWRRADGSKFKAQGVFVDNLNTGEVKVDNFRLRCIGN